MKIYSVPNTDMNISRICYGCMLLGGGWNHDPLTDTIRRQAVEVLKVALDEGINFFDHADIYSYGKSEEVFAGLWQGAPSLRQQIYLQSKCGIRFAGNPDESAPHRFDFSYEHILRSVEGSLKRLQTDYLDVLLLHRPDALVQPEEVAKAFDELHRAGKVRYFGVSNHTAAQISLLKRYLNQPLVFNQLELSVIHTHLLDEGIVMNQDEPERVIRNEGTLEYCREHDILIQAWRPLALGRLTGNPKAKVTESQNQTAFEVTQLAAQKQVSPEAILIAWLLRHPAGIQPVFGSTKPERVRACCQADTVELSREEWYRLFIAGRGGALP